MDIATSKYHVYNPLGRDHVGPTHAYGVMTPAAQCAHDLDCE